MWLEAILSQEDIVALVAQLTPVKLRFGNEGDLLLFDVSTVTLVPERGLRVVCKAKLHWPVLGIAVPVALNSLTVLLAPSVAKREAEDVLVFKVLIEDADLAGLPAMIDREITARVNDALDRTELAWSFKETLGHVFELPRSLELVQAVDLRASWGQMKVTAEALVFAVSFQATVTRGET